MSKASQVLGTIGEKDTDTVELSKEDGKIVLDFYNLLVQARRHLQGTMTKVEDRELTKKLFNINNELNSMARDLSDFIP